MNLAFTIAIAGHIDDDKLPGELAAGFRSVLRNVSGQIADRREQTHADEHADRVASAALQAAMGHMYEQGLRTGVAREDIIRQIADHAADIVNELHDRGDYTAPRDVVITS